MCGIFVHNADKFHRLQFAGKLVVNAGMIASECAYTDDGATNTLAGASLMLDIKPAAVKAEARWREDLDADSLAVVEITLALNDAFSIKIPDVDPDDLTTVGQALINRS